MLANARPLQAVAELVWNGLDADATKVDVAVNSTDLGMQSIIIRDNGGRHFLCGCARRIRPPRRFLAGMRGGRSKKKSRMLHGKYGKGRFKALALGRVADWTGHYERSKRHTARSRYAISLNLGGNLKLVQSTSHSTCPETAWSGTLMSGCERWKRLSASTAQLKLSSRHEEAPQRGEAGLVRFLLGEQRWGESIVTVKW